jgi:hypothetical protein
MPYAEEDNNSHTPQYHIGILQLIAHIIKKAPQDGYETKEEESYIGNTFWIVDIHNETK